ncbi:MAG TPA: hypothetical protein VFI18_04785 [Gaiellales bacterium]|nr:hypothetical protein [Gaiellales bacterium]
MRVELTAFIAEEVEFDERGPIATGLFSGSVQTEDGGITDAVDSDMSPREAIRWARERAQRVVVRIAGEQPCLDTEVDQTRTPRRRRPSGWEFLDRTSADPPILWDVIVEMEKDGPPYGPPTPAGTWTGYATMPHSIVQVEAAGYEDALAAAVQAAGDSARPPAAAFAATRAFPSGSAAAEANARLDADGTLF